MCAVIGRSHKARLLLAHGTAIANPTDCSLEAACIARMSRLNTFVSMEYQACVQRSALRMGGWKRRQTRRALRQKRWRVRRGRRSRGPKMYSSTTGITQATIPHTITVR